jgi:hypothetical protein
MFIKLKTRIKTIMGRKIKTLSSDWGGEFLFKELQNIWTKNGIIQQLM